MTGTVVLSLAAVAFFLLLLEGVRVGFGVAGLLPRLRKALVGLAGVAFPWVVYVGVRLLDDVAALRPLVSFFEVHRRVGLLVTVGSAGLGFTLVLIAALLYATVRSIAAAIRA